MSLVVKDRIKETSTTAGTGAITLNGAEFGFQSFSVVGNGNTTYYAIVDSMSGAWEVGIGTYTSSGSTLSRDTVLESSNSGSLVSFSSNSKDVFVTYPAEKSFGLDQILSIANGGTNASTAQTARANLLPAYAGNAGKVLAVNTGATDVEYISVGGTGTVTSVDLSAGTGISVSGGPITSSGSITVTNTAPDQVVSLTGAGTTSITGTYPNFTITSNDQYVGTVTSVGGTGTVNGITLTGTVTSSGSLTLGGTLSGVNLATQVTGTLPVANGGTGQTSFTNGQLLIGNSTGNTLTKATLTAGTNVTITNGSGAITVSSASADIQLFSVAGSSTWTKPSGAKTVQVICIGAGGGGGSGRKGAAATPRIGGGGGGGGAISTAIFDAADLTSTVSVTVGSGGTGGASRSTNSTNGANGNNGGNTTFGTYLYAVGGTGGTGGANSGTATGGVGGKGSQGTGGNGGDGQAATSNIGTIGVSGAPAGGGSGGGITNANAVSGGAQGYNTTRSTAPSWINGNTGTPTSNSVTGAGSSGTNLTTTYRFGGESGDGGGASTSGAAGAGGDGGNWGGGGGGGGASLDSVGNSGAGGTGGNGLILVVTSF